MDLSASLSELNCVSCRGNAPKLTDQEIDDLQALVPLWDIVEKGGLQKLERSFKFRDFKEAIAFSNRVAVIAEVEDHHPAMLIEWGSVVVSWWTHTIHGLHKNDFIMAAKTDKLFNPQ